MPEIRLSLSFSPLVVLVAVAAAAFLAAAAYRSTVPPVPRSLRILLGILRGSAVTLLVLLLGEPLLSVLHRSVVPPGILVLIDHSRSMTLDDRGQRRSAAVIGVLGSREMADLSSSGELSHALFDGGVTPLAARDPDSLKFSGSRTNIEAALLWARQSAARGGDEALPALRNLRAVVLISDGAITEGSHPAFEAPHLGFPVFTVGVGDSLPERDVLVRNVAANAFAYKGSRVPVTAQVGGIGVDGARVEVVLRDEGGELARKVLTFEADRAEHRVPLSFVAETVGNRRLVVEVSPLTGERTTKNNRFAFSVRVLESRIRVLLIAGGPSPDVAFVRRAFESDTNIEINTLIVKQGGAFYEGAWSEGRLENVDAVVLIGFPTAAIPPGVVSSVARALEGRTPSLFVMSRVVDHEKLRQMQGALPFVAEPAGGPESRFFVGIPERQRLHPVFRLANDRSLADLLPKLPPLFALQGQYRAVPDARVLAVGSSGPVKDRPILVARSAGGTRALAILGYGLWQWDLQKSPVNGTERILENLIGNAVRWLTTVEDERRVRVGPLRDVVEGGEPVTFAAQVFDESLNPVEDADVEVSIRGGGRMIPLKLEPTGYGQYEGSLPGLPEGAYRYEATVRRRDELLGEDTGDLRVEEGTLEFRETTMNKMLLQQLAERSGGSYFDAADIDGLAEAVRGNPGVQGREEVRAAELRGMNSIWMLGVVVALLAAEWILRRRAGML